MVILFLGDVTGKAGLEYVEQVLPQWRTQYAPDLVIANGENAGPAGRGITSKQSEMLFDAGVEIITMGNHTWDLREAYDLLAQEHRIVRPANFSSKAPGHGYTVCQVGQQLVAIVSVIGRTFMAPHDCPFATMERILNELQDVTAYCLVDFHAEATSEKLAMGWFLDGRVSAVFGTHTHVQTADERILPQGTAYITDVGMTGPRDGILGVRRDQVIGRFLDQMPVRFEVASGARQCSAVLVTLNAAGKAMAITRLHQEEAV